MRLSDDDPPPRERQDGYPEFDVRSVSTVFVVDAFDFV